MKKNIAVFMGAGASKPFGHLLTSEILPQIKKEIPTGELFEDEDEWITTKEVSDERRKDLEMMLEALLPGFNAKNIKLPDGTRQAEIKLPLVTDVLSIIDHSLMVSNVPFSLKSLHGAATQRAKNVENLMKFRALLEQAIFDVLVWTYETSGAGDQSANLKAFTEWIENQAEAKGQSLGIISTNYDIAVEKKLFNRYRKGLPQKFDFGFSWRDAQKDQIYLRPEEPLLRFYKLHGSLNWLRCDLCEQVYINTHGSIAHHAFREDVDENNTCYCGHAPLRSVIVAPSLVRDVRDTNLLATWKNALQLLRTADEWVIIGYSFPPEDIAIRSLFLRAYQGHWKFSNQTWKRKDLKITVVQRGFDADIFHRYRIFFPECDYRTDGLEGFLS